MYYFLYCSGKMHRISVSSSGKLVLHNHTPEEIEIELAMGALDSDNSMCPCVRVYRLWKDRKYEELPNILKEELDYED